MSKLKIIYTICLCDILWLRRALEKLKSPVNCPKKLYCHNKAIISIVDRVLHDGTKHVEMDKHFVKEKLEGGIIYTPFVPNTSHVADVLTKALSRQLFEIQVSKLNMMDTRPVPMIIVEVPHANILYPHLFLKLNKIGLPFVGTGQVLG